MFPASYFPERHFAPRYWPKVGAEPPPTVDVIASTSLRGEFDYQDALKGRFSYQTALMGRVRS